jgi:hypothetical protein
MSRRVELDVLRGMLLVTMVLNHLPTRFRMYSDQPLGFVSAAEGFVFLSAFVAGRTYVSLLDERGSGYVRHRIWAQARRVYGYHIALLGFAFTVIAVMAAATGRPGIRNLLGFYFDFPGVALLGGTLLLYQPPLLDILPMYVVFLALTPVLLEMVQQRGFRWVLAGSVLLWTFAQVGGKSILHSLFCAATGLPLPLDAAGSFDQLAWQLVWVAGLWAGARRCSAPVPAQRVWLVVAGVVALGFLVWRHRIGGLWLDLGPREPWLDKWHLGWLRLLNFAALVFLVSKVFLPLLRHLRVSALSALGRASLQAFTAHAVLCLLSLGFVVDVEVPLSLPEEGLVLGLTFAAMVLVARRASATRASRRALAQ